MHAPTEPDDAPTRRPVNLEIIDPFFDTVDAGAPLTINLIIDAEDAELLAGTEYAVQDSGGHNVMSGHLPEIVRLVPQADEYDPRHGPVDPRPRVCLQWPTPAEPGRFEWTLVVFESETDGIAFGRGRVPIAFETRGHATSLAVWGYPSPIVAGKQMTLWAGAKCSAGCDLAGRVLQLLDSEGEVLSEGRLGATPHPGTEALFWCALTTLAHRTEGRHHYSVHLLPASHPIEHSLPRPTSFKVTVVPPPAHGVSIVVHDKATAEPVARAHVRLGVFRGTTDAAGWVHFDVAAGEYRLSIWKDNVDAPARDLRVDDDVELQVSAEVRPAPDPYAHYYS